MTNSLIVPIFIVNLDESPDRFEEMQTQLKELNLLGQRIAAVRGSNLSQQELAQVYCPVLNNKHFRRELSLGEIGCYLSHRKVWQKMIEENIELAIVLEDDIFVKASITSVERFVKQLKQFDLIKLADNRNYPPAAVKPLADNQQLVSYRTIPNCTTGYAVTLSGARKFMTREKIYRPVDIDMQHCYELDVSVVGLLPYPVDENPKWDSDIARENAGKRYNPSKSFWRNLKYRIKQAYYRKFYISAKF